MRAEAWRSPGSQEAWFLLSVDDNFSRMNTGRTIEQSLAVLAELRQIAEGSGTRLGTYLIASFGGPAGPPRGPHDIRPVLDRMIDIGLQDWILADSCGYAAPPHVTAMVRSVAPWSAARTPSPFRSTTAAAWA